MLSIKGKAIQAINEYAVVVSPITRVKQLSGVPAGIADQMESGYHGNQEWTLLVLLPTRSRVACC